MNFDFVCVCTVPYRPKNGTTSTIYDNKCSGLDWHGFNADPDTTFHFDADQMPDPNHFPSFRHVGNGKSEIYF
jgi:hypothetical protein